MSQKQSQYICVKSNDLNATGNNFSCNNKPGFNKTDTSSGMSEHIVQKVSNSRYRIQNSYNTLRQELLFVQKKFLYHK